MKPHKVKPIIHKHDELCKCGHVYGWHGTWSSGEGRCERQPCECLKFNREKRRDEKG